MAELDCKRKHRAGHKLPFAYKSCVCCGNALIDEARVATKMYCSTKCKTRDWRLRRPELFKHCRQREQKKTNERCAPWHVVYPRYCELCRAYFVGRNKYVKQCKSCRYVTQAARSKVIGREKASGPRKCRQCSKEYQHVFGWPYPSFCSAPCRDESAVVGRREARKKHRERFGRDSGRSRARRHGVAYESINRIKVFDRDGWKCQICGRQTPRGLLKRNESPRQPTIDHRIPFARGGEHTYDNVQCACRDCNTKKRHLSEVGQLPLFSIT